jgi:His-Xaa-Ser system radical SAM maturase HxsB
MTVDAPVSIRDRSSRIELLPFRFHRLADDRILVTNMVGEHLYLTSTELNELVNGAIGDPQLEQRLRGKHIVRSAGDDLPVELLAMKVSTRLRRLPQLTGLHIFVVTLRCEHACGYCQVSRKSSASRTFDMSEETADLALNVAFRSPSAHLKLELQGGEPLLSFDLVRYITERAERRAADEGRSVSFVIATNLALLDDEVIEFARHRELTFSTSLDGPADLHNRNRPRPGADSWARAVAGIRRIQAELGPDRVDALMTTTPQSLGRAPEIIDTYAELGLANVFLRPISPYGFAARNRRLSFDVERWLEFYEEGLDHVLALNAAGTPMVETYASIVLRKMLTNDDAGYVDLMTPAGIGIGALVYNYDGDVYASDEGRMLAEMDDYTFRLGSVYHDRYEDLMTADALLDPIDVSFAPSVPMCDECAYESFCGSDPVFHHTTMGDAVGRKAESEFCARNMGVFNLLLARYASDRSARHVFRRWANR